MKRGINWGSSLDTRGVALLIPAPSAGQIYILEHDYDGSGHRSLSQLGDSTRERLRLIEMTISKGDRLLIGGNGNAYYSRNNGEFPPSAELLDVSSPQEALNAYQLVDSIFSTINQQHPNFNKIHWLKEERAFFELACLTNIAWSIERQEKKIAALWGSDIANRAAAIEDDELRETTLYLFEDNHEFSFNKSEIRLLSQLFAILDQNRYEPSIARDADEIENHLGPAAFAVLAEVGLLKHTLTVAGYSGPGICRTAINQFRDTGDMERLFELHVEQDKKSDRRKRLKRTALIAALCHDLGRLPLGAAPVDEGVVKVCQSRHAAWSLQILQSLDGYAGLRHKGRICAAVLWHHATPNKDWPFLTRLIHDADISARREEIVTADSNTQEETVAVNNRAHSEASAQKLAACQTQLRDTGMAPGGLVRLLDQAGVVAQEDDEHVYLESGTWIDKTEKSAKHGFICLTNFIKTTQGGATPALEAAGRGITINCYMLKVSITEQGSLCLQYDLPLRTSTTLGDLLHLLQAFESAVDTARNNYCQDLL